MRHALGKKEATAIGRSTERVCLSILWGRDGGRNYEQPVSTQQSAVKSYELSATSPELLADG